MNKKEFDIDEYADLSPKYADDFLNVYEESLSAAAQGRYNPLTPEEIDEFGLDFDFCTMYEFNLEEYEKKFEELKNNSMRPDLSQWFSQGVRHFYHI